MTPTAGRRRAALAVAAALLLAPLAGPSSAADATVTVRPTTSGDTAVHDRQTVTVSGTVPSGAVLRGARLLGLRADGSLLGVQPVDRYTLGAPAPSPTTPVTGGGGDYLRVDGTTLSGRLTLFCLFAAPNPSCAERGGAAGEVRTLQLEVGLGSQAVTSGPVRVDYTRPVLRNAALIDPTTLVARFTEPVRSPQGQPDLPSDWQVTVGGSSVPVITVGGPTAGDCVGQYAPADDASAGPTGCSRTLTLATAQDEDATPSVTYDPYATGVPGRAAVEDFASNRALVVDLGARVAADRIRPPRPTLTSLAGKAPTSGRVDAAVAAPVASVSGLRAGHSVFARISRGGSTVQTPDVRATGATLDLPLPDLSPDGESVVQLVVRDPSGNLSTDSTRSARADGGPSLVTYGLDRVAPAVTAADIRGDTVVVTFSEPVAGSDATSAWSVTGGSTSYPVTAVSGNGSTRTLDVKNAPPGATVQYAPGGNARYADRAGNVVPDSALPANGVPLPVLTSPDGPLITRDSATTVIGTTGRSGLRVEVYRDTNADGAPDGAAVATTGTAADGSFTVSVPLAASARNDLLVRAVDPATTTASRYVPVPPVTQDAVAPTLSLLAPTGGEVLAGGSALTVRWNGCDANPRTVQVLLAPDGTSFGELTTAALAASCGSDSSVQVELPRVDSAVARLRLVATDAAGNSTPVTSGAFTLDATPPVFTARTQDASTVVVTFTEPVSGPVKALDWTVAGSRAARIAVDGGSAGPGGSASGARRFTLTTSPAAPAIGPDDRPLVGYDPTLASAPTPVGGQLVDRASQPVPAAARVVEAADGIAPAAPVVTDPASRVYTSQSSYGYRGTAQPGTTVRLLDEQGAQRSPAGPVAQDGSWTARGDLPADTSTALRAVVVDAAGNASPQTQAPAVVQDSADPAVAIDSPQARQSFPTDTDVPVRWRAADANLAPSPVVVDVTTDGGRTWTVLGSQQPASGTLTWRTPSKPTSVAGVRVRALDLAGRTGTATVGYLGVGAPASAEPFAPPAAPLVPAVPTQPTTGPSALGRALGALPRTGADLARVTAVALIALTGGLVALAAGRDRRRRRA